MFTRKIIKGEVIEVYNDGDLMRDFTFIDDIIRGIELILEEIPRPNSAFNSIQPDPSISSAPYQLYNLGNQNPVKLLDFIESLERIVGIKARKQFLSMQQGDVNTTFADISAMAEKFGYMPATKLDDGLRKFVDWYRSYYND